MLDLWHITKLGNVNIQKIRAMLCAHTFEYTIGYIDDMLSCDWMLFHP